MAKVKVSFKPVRNSEGDWAIIAEYAGAAVGILTAALLLGEPIDLSLAIAAALIVGGIALSSLADAPARA